VRDFIAPKSARESFQQSHENQEKRQEELSPIKMEDTERVTDLVLVPLRNFIIPNLSMARR
jgi:hypothetical protein